MAAVGARRSAGYVLVLLGILAGCGSRAIEAIKERAPGEAGGLTLVDDGAAGALSAVEDEGRVTLVQA